MRGSMKKVIAMILAVAIIFSMIGCSKQDESRQNETLPNTPVQVIEDYDVNDNEDAFIDIVFNDMLVNNIEIDDLSVNDIVVNCVEVKSIELYEMEVVAINDEFITLAYENFVSYYNVDFDLEQFLTDIAIGSTIVLVYVTLSTAGGPVGSFFGAVVVSEISKSALLMGAALDAAVSAYKAYEEGGDATYIVGHMLNGVADGYKWGAMLAPITGAASGIKALRATKAVAQVLSADVSEEATVALIKNFAKIIKKCAKLSDLSDDALKLLYKELSNELPKEITEEIFIQAIKNKAAITSIIRQFNPFNVNSELTKALQEEFWEKADKSQITEKVGREIVNDIKDGTIKKLEDISDDTIKVYIKNNMYSFVQCYGKALSKDFLDNSLKDSMGEVAYNALKDVITKKNGYVNLVKKLGLETTNQVLENPEDLILITMRFGSDNLSYLRYGKQLYAQLSKNGVDENSVLDVLDGILSKSIKDLESVRKISPVVANNLVDSRETVSIIMNNLKIKKSASVLFDDMAISGFDQLLRKSGLNIEMAKDIIENRLSKAQIVQKYGQKTYDLLLSKPSLVIDTLGIQTNVNKSLVSDIVEDTLKNREINSDAVEKILQGVSVNEWGLSSRQISDIGGVVSEYYRVVDSTTYDNYIKEYAEERGRNIGSFLEEYKKDYTITNEKFAGGIMEPSGENAEYIKMKYGDIYMTQSGFVVLDKYAVARVEISDLTGISNDDIAKANLAHHGIQQNIKGYTWHHLEDGKTLILVPTELHEAYKHTGGAALLRAGLNGA